MASELENKIIEVLTIWGEKLYRSTQDEINKAIAADGGGQTSSLAGDLDFQVLNKNGVVSFNLFFKGKGADYWDYANQGVDGTSVKHGSDYKFKKKNLNRDAMIAFIKKRHIKIEIDAKQTAQIKSLKNKTVRKGVKQIARDKQINTVAFLIGRSIAKKGIKPLGFIEKAVTDARLQELKQMLAPVIKQQFILEIKKELQ